MRRWLRILFNGLTVLSLLACVPIVALWVRSYREWDQMFLVATTTRSVRIASRSGEVKLIWNDAIPEKTPQPVPNAYQSEEVIVVAPYRDLHTYNAVVERLFGFGINTGSTWFDVRLRVLVFPHWFAVVVTLILPMGHTLMWWFRRAVPAGLCPACGYDLRASPERCPECGRVPTAK